MRTIVTMFATVILIGACGLARATDDVTASVEQRAPDGFVVFTLSPQQDREVQRLRVFRPTPPQLAVLRAARPACNNLLHVITERFQGCECERRNTAVWKSPGALEVHLGGLNPWSLVEEKFLRAVAAMGDTTAIRELAHPPAAPAELNSTELFRHSEELLGDLIMDLDGKIYYEGREVGDEDIVATLQSFKAAKGRRGEPGHSVNLLLPPPFTPHQDMSNVNRALELSLLAARVGFALRCGG